MLTPELSAKAGKDSASMLAGLVKGTVHVCMSLEERAALAGMRRAGVQPNTVSYNSLLSACERCGQAERALEVFGMMEREAGPTFGYTGSSLITYNTLISACGKAGMYDQVSQPPPTQPGRVGCFAPC